MDYILSISFATEDGGKSNLNISGVKPDMTPDQINGVMDTIIAKSVFKTDSGLLVRKANAHVTTKSVKKFDVSK